MNNSVEDKIETTSVNDKPHKKKRRFLRISIGLKVRVAIIVLASIYFLVAMRYGGKMQEIFSVDAQLGCNYTLARTLAIISDQNYVTGLYNQVREIYESTPEELLDDPMNPEYVARYAEVRTSEFENLRARLNSVSSENNLLWVCLEFDDPARNRTVCVLDSENRDDGKYDIGYWGSHLEYKDRDVVAFSVAQDATMEYETGEKVPLERLLISCANTTTSDGENLYVVRAPFYHPETNEITGYISVGQLENIASVEKYLFLAAYGSILLLLTIAFILVSTFAIRFMLVKPIRRLTKASDRFAKNRNKSSDKRFFQNLKIRTHDEVRSLADSMAQMEEDLTVYMDNLKKETAERERMSTELDVAAHIQATMLPNALTGYEGERSFDIAAQMTPAREVGGDFYDYFAIDQDHIGLVMADVSGKGVPAALFMVVSRTLIKNVTMEHASPAEAIRRVNDLLLEGNDENMFVTVWLGVYTVSERKLSFVNAGHESTALYRASTGSFELIDVEHDVALGVIEGLEFTQRELVLEPGDMLYLYTDGVPEAESATDERYGLDRMLACLDAHSHERGKTLLDSVKQDIDLFASGKPQYDDVTMLLFCCKGEDGSST